MKAGYFVLVLGLLMFTVGMSMPSMAIYPSENESPVAWGVLGRTIGYRIYDEGYGMIGVSSEHIATRYEIYVNGQCVESKRVSVRIEFMYETGEWRSYVTDVEEWIDVEAGYENVRIHWEDIENIPMYEGSVNYYVEYRTFVLRKSIWTFGAQGHLKENAGWVFTVPSRWIIRDNEFVELENTAMLTIRVDNAKLYKKDSKWRLEGEVKLINPYGYSYIEPFWADMDVYSLDIDNLSMHCALTIRNPDFVRMGIDISKVKDNFGAEVHVYHQEYEIISMAFVGKVDTWEVGEWSGGVLYNMRYDGQVAVQQPGGIDVRKLEIDGYVLLPKEIVYVKGIKNALTYGGLGVLLMGLCIVAIPERRVIRI